MSGFHGRFVRVSDEGSFSEIAHFLPLNGSVSPFECFYGPNNYILLSNTVFMLSFCYYFAAIFIDGLDFIGCGRITWLQVMTFFCPRFSVLMVFGFLEIACIILHL